MKKWMVVIGALGLAAFGGCGTHTGIGGLGGGTGGHADAGRGCVVGAGGRAGAQPSSTLSFLDGVNYAGGISVYGSPAIGDLNGDGKPDIAFPANSLGDVEVLFGDGRGGFGAPVATGISAGASLALGDVNGDGKLDIAVADYSGLSIGINQGGGTFAAPATYAVGDESTALAFGDLDGDGKLDIAVANAGGYDRGSGAHLDGDVAVLLNTGKGTFAAANYAAGSSPIAVAIGDLDGDCKPDLAVGDVNGLRVLLNSGNGVFRASVSYGAGTHPTSVAIGDLNGDGAADIAETNGATSNDDRFYVLSNFGNGTFAAAVGHSAENTPDGSVPSGISSVAIGDLNGDGRGDVAAASSCCGVATFVNRGDGTFAAPTVYSIGTVAVSVAIGDLDGDGRNDLAIGFDDGVSVRLNDSP